MMVGLDTLRMIITSIRIWIRIRHILVKIVFFGFATLDLRPLPSGAVNLNGTDEQRFSCGRKPFIKYSGFH